LLNHKHTLVFFTTLAVVLVAIDWSFDVPGWFYAAIVLLFISVEAYGAANIAAGFHIHSFCKGTTGKKEIALTFDDGPTPQSEKILDLLKAANVKATFFLIGHRIAGHESIVRRMIDEGHTIGNHSFAHNYWYDLKTKKNMLADLKRTEELIFSISGKRSKFFRPPYGVTTPALSNAIRLLGYQSIGWSMRSLDTQEKGTEFTTKRIVERLQPGAIVLLHDTVKGTEFVVQKLLSDLPAKGYQVVPLPQLIEKEPYV